jgi:hypothetical protein
MNDNDKPSAIDKIRSSFSLIDKGVGTVLQRVAGEPMHHVLLVWDGNGGLEHVLFSASCSMEDMRRVLKDVRDRTRKKLEPETKQ